MSEPTPDPILNDDERRTLASLASLRPARLAGDFAPLALASLERSHRRQLRTWQAAAATLTIALGISLATSAARSLDAPPVSPASLVASERPVDPPTPPAPRPVRPAPPAPGDATAPSQRPLSPRWAASDFLALRNAVLEGGLDALPQTPHRRGEPTPAFLPTRSLPPASGV
jgi:hypothetical protein